MDVHGTASNTSAAGLQVLRSSLGCRDLSNKGTMISTAWKRNSGTLLYNFNSGTLASGKTRLAPETKATFA